MARYATTEEQYLCGRCDALPTLREMTVYTMKTVNKDVNYHCPRCNTHLLVTNDHGLFMRVYHMEQNSLRYIRTDGINEPLEGV